VENVTARGWFMLGVCAGLAVWGLWEVATHLFWNGSGWEWCEDLATCSTR
jgi:hypothetical protein